jgi:hypothetical protein
MTPLAGRIATHIKDCGGLLNADETLRHEKLQDYFRECLNTSSHFFDVNFYTTLGELILHYDAKDDPETSLVNQEVSTNEFNRLCVLYRTQNILNEDDLIIFNQHARFLKSAHAHQNKHGIIYVQNEGKNEDPGNAQAYQLHLLKEDVPNVTTSIAAILDPAEDKVRPAVA